MQEQIIKMIEDILKLQPGSINRDTKIEDIEAWDSLAHVMIIGAIEEELKVLIPLDVAVELESVEQLLEAAGC